MRDPTPDAVVDLVATIGTGRLVRLFEAEAALREEYTAVWNPASPRADLVRPFVDWLASVLEPTPAPVLHAA